MFIFWRRILSFHLRPSFFTGIGDIEVLKTLYILLQYGPPKTCLSIVSKLLWQVLPPESVRIPVSVPFWYFTRCFFPFHQINSNCTINNELWQERENKKDQWLRNGVVTDASYFNPSTENKEIRGAQCPFFPILLLFFFLLICSGNLFAFSRSCHDSNLTGVDQTINQEVLREVRSLIFIQRESGS